MDVATDARLEPWPGEPESLAVTVDTGDSIHYLDWNFPPSAAQAAGRPPTLLVHGLAQTAWSWTPIARRIRNVGRVIAVDLRGHGLSDSPRRGYDLASLAYDVLTVASANGWGADVDGPSFAVCGHGLGAMVAATMATLRPTSIAAVALVDGGWENLAEATGQTADDYQRALGDPPEVLSSMAALLADRRDYDPSTWDADQQRAARAAVDQKHAGHVALVARPHVIRSAVAAMFDYRPDEAATSLVAPLLVAVAESGAADDDEARLRNLALDDFCRRRASAGLAPPTIVRFAGAGHNLMRYRPRALAAALVDLLTAATSARTPGGPA